jgi:hypothetical protein
MYRLLTGTAYSLAALFWSSRYVTNHHLAVAPQSGAKDQFYCTVYCIPLNLNCKAQREFTNEKIIRT